MSTIWYHAHNRLKQDDHITPVEESGNKPKWSPKNFLKTERVDDCVITILQTKRYPIPVVIENITAILPTMLIIPHLTLHPFQ